MVNGMVEGRKRVLGIMASILVGRHLKTTEDLHDMQVTSSHENRKQMWRVELETRHTSNTLPNRADYALFFFLASTKAGSGSRSSTGISTGATFFAAAISPGPTTSAGCSSITWTFLNLRRPVWDCIPM